MISVGIPYTDQGELLGLAIQSVLNQSHSDFELILYGDGPDPLTRNVAKRYTDPRIRHYENPSRRGLSFTLNQISKSASYPMLARMDGDDIMHPARLAHQLKFMMEHPGTDLVGTKAYVIDENGRLMGAYKEPDLPTHPKGYLASSAFTHPTVLGRTSWFLANPYDERLLRAEDKELWLRTNTFSNFCKMEDRLLYYRIDSRVSRKKQGKDARYDRRVVRSFNGLDSPFGVSRRLFTSIAKQMIVAGFDAAGRSGVIYRTKFTPISTAEHRRQSAIINEIYTRSGLQMPNKYQSGS